ncbi:hypothetical protein [Nocardia wallacei]|uniref:hypothetical protein n=1 Tax=Nocardia wallacei TaxID=480035 RepID=UPI0024545918|nr:hypothetical protein [Nocardia wallacei]
MTERHGVKVDGFDQPELSDTAVREFAAAVDRMLTDYSAITLDVVAVAGLSDATSIVQWNCESRGTPAKMRSITLDQQVAHDPDCAVVAKVAIEQGNAESDHRAIYAETVRELGLALDSAGEGIVGRNAQRILIAEYLRSVAGRYTTLGELARGYRDWRAGLIGTAGDTVGFDPRRALRAAFAEVVMHGDQACMPAKTLHGALVDAASGRM